jgi:GNAT superfamily N-acetyltransferase
VTPADLAALEAMVRAYYLEDGHPFHEDRQLPALRQLAAGEELARGWMVEIEGSARGYAILTISFSLETGGRDGFIDEIFLEPDLRNQGLGRRLLTLIEDEARALGLQRLYLEVERHNPAIRLYERAGYEDHERYLMSKRI